MVWNSNCDHFTYISFKKYLGSKDLKTSCILVHPNVLKYSVHYFFFSELCDDYSYTINYYQSVYSLFPFNQYNHKYLFGKENTQNKFSPQLHFYVTTCMVKFFAFYWWNIQADLYYVWLILNILFYGFGSDFIPQLERNE